MSKFCIILSHKNEINYSEKKEGVYYAALSSSFKDKAGKQPKNSEGRELKCILESVHYSKKIYEPCMLEIQVTVDILGSSVDNTISYYKTLFSRGEISVIEDLADATKAEANNLFSIITKYVICVIIPRDDTSDASHMKFCLKAYSPDKALDIKSYCETFYSSKLSSIISGKLNKNSGEFKNFNIDYSFSDIGLTYKKEGKDVEFNMPYLVQYNETFYQFLVRTANRCNKAVYFEEGTLYIGDRSEKKDYTRENLTGAIIEYPDTYDYGDSGFSPSLFASDYCSGDPTISSLSENDELIDNSQSYKIVDDDNYTVKKDIISDEIREISLLGYTVQGDSLTNVMANWIEKETEYSHVRDWIKEDLDKDWKRGDGPVKLHNATLPEGEGVSSNPLKNSWYQAIVKKQKAAELDKRVFTFVNHANKFLLGDTFNKSHSVIEITGDWSYEMVIPPAEPDVLPSPQPCVANKIVVTAMTIGCTPYLGEKRIRRATPHKAIVAQVNDPLRMGRVRIKFPWDSTKTLSPWIRVNTAAAYDGGGLLFTPKAGDEAMVDFEDGNIERPFVTGFVHTKKRKPYIGSRTYNKRARKYTTMKSDKEGDNNDYGSCTITNRTGQSITLENGANGNNFYKALNPAGGAQIANEKIFSDDKKLGGCITLSDGYGVCTIKSDTGSRKISLQSALGNIELSAYTGVTVSCPNGDIKLKGKNITLEAGNNINIKSGGNKGGLGCYATMNSIAENVTEKCMELWDAHWAYYHGSAVIKGLVDMSFHRTILETVLRPLEGTTMIKTPGYILLSAKNGTTMNDIGKPKGFEPGSTMTYFHGWGTLGSSIEKWARGKESHQKKQKNAWGILTGTGLGILDGLTNTLGLSSVGDILGSDIAEMACNVFNGNSQLFAGASTLGGVYASDSKDLEHHSIDVVTGADIEDEPAQPVVEAPKNNLNIEGLGEA